MNFLGLDVGTTRMKCGVYSEEGILLWEDGREYGLRAWKGDACIDLEDMKACMLALLERAYRAAPFQSIAISSLGESFALLGEGDELLCPPALYSDGGGEEEAARFEGEAERIFAVAGAAPQGMYSAYKLLWMKKNAPEAARAKKLLLIADYLGYVLTGERAADTSSAARTGVFDVRRKAFSEELCALFGIDAALFSPAVPSGAVVGEVRPEILRAWGASSPVLLVAGGHDQVMASLGAGAAETGACVDGMGTVECVTALFRDPPSDPAMGRCGFPVVPYCTDGLYCTYLVNYSCGSLVRWWLDLAYPDGGKDVFRRAEEGFPAGPTGLFVLPYFAGVSTPYIDRNVHGGFVNLDLSRTPSEIYKGILEGLCMEVRLNLEAARPFGIAPDRLLAAGGGAASRKWLQIKADVTGLPVYPPACGEAGVLGAATAGAAALLKEPVRTVAARFVKTSEPILPDPLRQEQYDGLYEKYKNLYFALKQFGERR